MSSSHLTAADHLALRDNAFASAKAYAASASTRRGYAADWTCFAGWCQAHGLEALLAAPETVGSYLGGKAGSLSVATLGRRLAAVAVAHRLAGYQLDMRHPAIRAVMQGIRRQHGSAQRQATAATVDVVRAMAATCGADLMGLRDRALLLLGFADAFRRAELVALRVEDLSDEAGGLRLSIRRRKGNQAGEGQVVGIARTGCSGGALARRVRITGSCSRSPSMPLSDTARSILTEASQHPLGIAKPPATLPAAARHAVFRSLLRQDLVVEYSAPATYPGFGWRQADGTTTVMQITEAGRQAISCGRAPSAIDKMDAGGQAAAKYDAGQEAVQLALDAGTKLEFSHFLGLRRRSGRSARLVRSQPQDRHHAAPASPLRRADPMLRAALPATELAAC